MIHAYSTESAIPNKALFKRNVDAAFEDLVIGERAVTLNKKSAYLIQAIDGSKLLNSLNVEAISGETIGIEKLSTGCKAALLIQLLPEDYVISCIEVGENALEQILRMNRGSIYLPWVLPLEQDIRFDMSYTTPGRKQQFYSYHELFEAAGGTIWQD